MLEQTGKKIPLNRGFFFGIFFIIFEITVDIPIKTEYNNIKDFETTIVVFETKILIEYFTKNCCCKSRKTGLQ